MAFIVYNHLDTDIEPTKECIHCVDLDSVEEMTEDELNMGIILRKFCKNCEDGRQKLEYPYYLNVHQVELHYGGAEEGGWWYDSGTLLETTLVHNSEQRKFWVDHLVKYYDDVEDVYLRRGKSSCTGGYDITISISPNIGTDYSDYQPYC